MNYKRYAKITIVLLVLFFIFIPTVHAERNTYKVGTDSLNVRSEPSHSSSVIGQLDNGDQVVAFKESYGWVMTYFGGKEVWVASQFLVPAKGNSESAPAANSNPAPATNSESAPAASSEPATDTRSESTANTSSESESRTNAAAANKQHVTVTATEVRVRTGPGTQHTILGTVSSGDTFRLLNTKQNWHKVQLQDGTIGWIASWLTNTAAGATDKPKTVNQTSIKSEPNSSSLDSLNGYTIMLDPGHGGKDPGSIGIDGVYEKEIISSTAQHIAEKLRQSGANVILTRKGDSFLSLEERVNLSESYDTDAFISLHYNAFPLVAANGFSTHYYSGGDDRTLANSLQSAIARNISLESRGIMQDDYHVLRENSKLAVLLELGFITNPYDQSTIQTASYKSNVANGIVEGLKNYFAQNG